MRALPALPFGMKNNPLPRLDRCDNDLRRRLEGECRLRPGQIWEDPSGRHRVACGDVADQSLVTRLAHGCRPTLAVHDPPYNMVMASRPVDEFVDWCRGWVEQTYALLADDGALYIWLGADQNNHFQPLPQFMVMMAGTAFASRSFITMRNQRGYGTQKNWMSVRQELLYYIKGEPSFEVQHTDIPKILRGYYKDVGGRRTENIERSKADTIRPGNVWVDIQQVFYRMHENVNGCYAQKPLKSIERIVKASSQPGEAVVDFFGHSGTTLLACERLNRRCLTMDIDPLFAEISIRRLERYRSLGDDDLGRSLESRMTGWQNDNPFEVEAYPQTAQKERTGRVDRS